MLYFGLRVIVIASDVRDSRYRGQSLRAAHGPAERAALSTSSACTRHQAPAVPASHNRTTRRRYATAATNFVRS